MAISVENDCGVKVDWSQLHRQLLSGASRNRRQGVITRTVQCACYGIGVNVRQRKCHAIMRTRFRARIVVMNSALQSDYSVLNGIVPTRYGTPRSVSAA